MPTLFSVGNAHPTPLTHEFGNRYITQNNRNEGGVFSLTTVGFLRSGGFASPIRARTVPSPWQGEG